jgi:hypothetical protein
MRIFYADSYSEKVFNDLEDVFGEDHNENEAFARWFVNVVVYTSLIAEKKLVKSSVLKLQISSMSNEAVLSSTSPQTGPSFSICLWPKQENLCQLVCTWKVS